MRDASNHKRRQLVRKICEHSVLRRMGAGIPIQQPSVSRHFRVDLIGGEYFVLPCRLHRIAIRPL